MPLIKLLALWPLAFDTFATSLGIGLRRPEPAMRVRIALTFMAAEGLMPIAGVLAGSGIRNIVAVLPMAAGILLILLGVLEWFEDVLPRRPKQRTLPLYAVALVASLDEFGVGVGLGAAGLPLSYAAPWFALQALVAGALGQYIGSRGARWLKEPAERVAATALIAVGVLLLLQR